MFKGAKKDDLRQIASELKIKTEDTMTMLEIMELIKAHERFVKDADSVKEMAALIIEERKSKDFSEVEIEKLKLERSKVELELVRLRTENFDKSCEGENHESLDSIVKSIRTLTVKIPSKPEGWGFFFSSLERAFSSKNVPDSLKAEILLNLLGERASNVLIYIKDEDLTNYVKIKEIVLNEFQPTPIACLENFRRAVRDSNETYLQFVSRLTTSFDYYLNLRNVSDFISLKQLIVSDKIYQTLDKETASHISVRQGDTWFKPNELGKEIDLFLTSRGKTLPENYGYRKNFNSRNSKVFFSDVKGKCILCSDLHHISSCPEYIKMNVADRVQLIKRHKLCFKCLSQSSPPHSASQCKSSKQSCNCKRGIHHKTLHFNRQEGSNNKNASSELNKSENEVGFPGSKNLQVVDSSLQTYQSHENYLNVNAPEFHNNHLTFTSNDRSKKHNLILLSTAKCILIDQSGNEIYCRALLDVGSSSNFVTQNCVDMMQLRKEKTNIVVSGLNDASILIRKKVNALLCNEDKSFVRDLNFLVVPSITKDLMPSCKIDINFNDFCNVKLADEKFNFPHKVDILVGAEIFYELLRPGQIRIANTNLLLQNTVFGFVVSGSATTEKKERVHCGLVREEIDLDNTLKRFWQIEEVDAVLPPSKDYAICEEHFKDNFMRDKTGRYIVKMPLKEDPNCLGQSKGIAFKKLNSLWNRLIKDPEYSDLYTKFMCEYREMGHMVEIEDSDEQGGSYYIPHLGVYRPESVSSPLRVVFNASSLTSKGNSLNSIQYNGGVIQDDLFGIMCRFRKHIYAFTADIKKMYRMISIHPSQRKLQRIVWKENQGEKPKVFELTTVTYGTVSAPFLATRTLIQLARDERKRFPLASSILESDFYMDDVLTGSESLDSAKALQRELIEILECGKMQLHKWSSNDPKLAVSDGDTYPFSNLEGTKTLGVFWQCTRDKLCFNVKLESDSEVTKRMVLSTIAHLYDPLGVIGPIISKAKIFMQTLWLLNLGWNEKLPPKEAEQWKLFSASLQYVNNIRVDRCIVIPNAILIELHGFADASEAAYGAAVFCKCRSESGEVSVTLVASKSRVSPLKKLTIPKLELAAAVLLAKLITRVTKALNMTINDFYLWTDSMIVLCWLQKEPYQLKTFVGNRIAKIRELTPVQKWRHINSEQNPADCLSRGIDPEKLVNNALWWTGPSFLLEDRYPEKDILVTIDQNEFTNELKNSLYDSSDLNFNCLLLSSNSLIPFVNSIFNISNNYGKVIRIVSYIFRFIRNCKNPQDKNLGPLEVRELKDAETFLLKTIQGEAFSNEVSKLNKKGEVSKDSRLKNLHPFLDEAGLLRVGGRLSYSNLSADKKYPILLPPKHRVTRLILTYYHQTYLHLGPQSLLYQVRQKFWPLNGRTMCREIVHNCVRCFKTKPKACEQLMGSLPKERITANYPFNCSGVDFTGPYLIKYKHQRKGIYHKIYVALFICFVTKSVHLEIVTDLSSQAFIAALKRFFARRGVCTNLYSDNATNFIGSDKELKKLYNMVQNPDGGLSGYLAKEGVDWKFLPPRAPNFGGLWEAGVKSFKYHLKRVMGNSKLTYEEFLTLTVQIEGILNSRPLVPLTSDIDDLKALTPGHFLIGRPIHSIVEPDITHLQDTRLSSWQKITKMTQIIWKRWSNDYLSHMQQRTKWFFQKDNIKIGDLVVIKEDNMAVCNWPLGRIVEIFPGKDGKIRVITVKTQRGLFKRPISKICLLPMENES